MNNIKRFKIRLGYLFLDVDDWFAKKHIYFNFFSKNKETHVNFLCRWGFNLIFDEQNLCPHGDNWDDCPDCRH